MNLIKDKEILILGASSGMGEAIVRRLAEKGGKLMIASRCEEKLKALRDSLTSENVATAAAYAIKTPDRMSVNEIVIRPTQTGDLINNNGGDL